MKDKRLRLLLILLALLAGAVGVANIIEGPAAEPAAEEDAALMDAMLDRIGVTRWAESLEWLEMEEAGRLPSGMADPQTPAWIARGGSGAFHSVPLCGAMKGPVRTTVGEALAEGRVACAVCWVSQE